MTSSSRLARGGDLDGAHGVRVPDARVVQGLVELAAPVNAVLFRVGRDPVPETGERELRGGGGEVEGKEGRKGGEGMYRKITVKTAIIRL